MRSVKKQSSGSGRKPLLTLAACLMLLLLPSLIFAVTQTSRPKSKAGRRTPASKVIKPLSLIHI